MAITTQEWNELKASEQYGMYAQLSKDVEHYTRLTNDMLRVSTDLLKRLAKLEDDFKAHDKLGDFCPHTGR